MVSSARVRQVAIEEREQNPESTRKSILEQ